MTELDGFRALAQASRDLPPSEECKAIRERAGVLLKDIAEYCGVTVQAVGAWESGRSRPRGDARLRYVEVLRAIHGGAA